MQQQAIDKVRAEMTANPNNGYVQVVGNFLILHVTEHPEDAEKILSQNKTILKSVEAMRKVAERKKVGNYAVLSDSEGFAVVLDYFKSAEPEKPKPAVEPKPKAESKPKTEKKSQPEPPKVEPETEDGADDVEDIDFDSLLL